MFASWKGFALSVQKTNVFFFYKLLLITTVQIDNRKSRLVER